MAGGKIRTRNYGASAVLQRQGGPQVRSDTGGEIEVVSGVTTPGFSPVDLLHAALASCLAFSLRTAATRLGLAAALDEVQVHVTGEKALAGSSRVARFLIRFDISGSIDALQRQALIAAAEEICTVSNTLRGNAELVILA